MNENQKPKRTITSTTGAITEKTEEFDGYSITTIYKNNEFVEQYRTDDLNYALTFGDFSFEGSWYKRLFVDKWKKDERIAFRVERTLYSYLEQTAKENNIKMSELMEIVSKEYIKMIHLIYEKARFFATVPAEIQESILTQEKVYPPKFRQFTNAIKQYPHAERFSNWEKYNLFNYLDEKNEDEDETGVEDV